MIIGCTGNYRKKEFFSILDRICDIVLKEKILKKEDIEKLLNHKNMIKSKK